MTPDNSVTDLLSLETDRLLLRKLRLEDAEDMFEYAVDPEIARLGLWPPFRTLEDSIQDLTEALEGYAKGELVAWAIEHKADHKMIGRLGLNYSPHDARAELGYAFNRRYWGQGYATEAVRQALKFGFQEMELNRVGAVCLTTNRASMRILEKVGMKFEGVRREYILLAGQFTDLNSYSLLKREWLVSSF